MKLDTLIPYHKRKVYNARRKALQLKGERYYFDYARTESQRERSFVLRYKVFCLEQEFFPQNLYPHQNQVDGFDFLESTKHLIGFRSGQSGDVGGTIRIIRDPQNMRFLSKGAPISYTRNTKLPMEAYYSLQEFRNQGRDIEQVTSLAFTKGIREHMYFGLCKSVFLDAMAHDIDDVFIQANPLMAWLFEAIGFKKIYAATYSLTSDQSNAHNKIPVVGMHLDTAKITKEFVRYFSLSDEHFLLKKSFKNNKSSV